MSGHRGAIRSLAFSPSGKHIASGATDHLLKLWDVASQRRLGEGLSPGFDDIHDGHSGSINGLAFSPDGLRLASVSSDRTVRLWNVDFDSWEQLACQYAGRNLTEDEWRQYIGNDEYQKTCPNFP